MPTEFYIASSTGQFGPITTAQLRSLARERKLIPTDLIWYEGLSEWVAASRIKGLFPVESTSRHQRGDPVTRKPVDPLIQSLTDLVNRHIDPASTRELEALQKRVEAQLVIIDKKIEKAERRLSNEPPPAKQEEFVQAEIVPPPVDIRSRENGRRNAYSPTTRESPPVIVTAANSESFIDWLLAKFKSFGKMIPGAQCPACKENWVKEVFEKRLVESRQAYRTVTRRDKHYNKHSGQFVGTKVGETRRKEQVVVTVSTFLLSCHCKNCGHAWTEQQDEER